MNIKHPLFPLLQMVDAETYFEYLFGLCNAEASEMDTEEEPVLLPFSEF